MPWSYSLVKWQNDPKERVKTKHNFNKSRGQQQTSIMIQTWSHHIRIWLEHLRPLLLAKKSKSTLEYMISESPNSQWLKHRRNILIFLACHTYKALQTFSSILLSLDYKVCKTGFEKHWTLNRRWFYLPWLVVSSQSPLPFLSCKEKKNVQINSGIKRMK